MKETGLFDFFISHLNRIFCAKNQLVEKLPELRNQARFRDLGLAITGLLDEAFQAILHLKKDGRITKTTDRAADGFYPRAKV
jgi:hypothetical protein